MYKSIYMNEIKIRYKLYGFFEVKVDTHTLFRCANLVLIVCTCIIQLICFTTGVIAIIQYTLPYVWYSSHSLYIYVYRAQIETTKTCFILETLGSHRHHDRWANMDFNMDRFVKFSEFACEIEFGK